VGNDENGLAEWEAHVLEHSGPMMDLNYAIIGICGEAGEIAEFHKKANLRKRPDLVEPLIGELGDLLYYLTRAAQLSGLTLEQVMTHNIMKLEARRAAGMAIVK
jgi:NTP pyrophosphatase (non-canonical NTP hydrolase)